MTITRFVNGKTMRFILTENEMREAEEELVKLDMRDELVSDWECTTEAAQELAEAAYMLYNRGDGRTQSECVLDAYTAVYGAAMA